MVSEWPAQLQCHEGLQSLVDMCFLAGAGVGSLASGYLSDKFGRRHTLMVNVLLQAVLGECFVCVHQCGVGQGPKICTCDYSIVCVVLLLLYV